LGLAEGGFDFFLGKLHNIDLTREAFLEAFGECGDTGLIELKGSDIATLSGQITDDFDELFFGNFDDGRGCGTFGRLSAGTFGRLSAGTFGRLGLGGYFDSKGKCGCKQYSENKRGLL
jgi:hypothetical protein